MASECAARARGARCGPDRDVQSVHCTRGGALRRSRHSGRRRAAHRGRHDLQLSADQGRRARRRRENCASGEGALRDRLLSRCSPRGARRRAGGRRAGTADDQLTDVRRQQGVRYRHDQESAERHRHCGSADLRPFRARPRGAGVEAAVHHARTLWRKGTNNGDAAGTQPCRPQLHHRGRRRREDRPNQHRRRESVHRKAAVGRNHLDHAGLVHVVHEERPVFEAEAFGRPRSASQLLPEPRLSRVQHRVDAGVDHAGSREYFHHAQCHRRPALYGGRCEDRRRFGGARARTFRARTYQAGRSVFARTAAAFG